ncbi:MAG: sulfurtransferase [Chloroflexota bacterium]
MLRLPSAIVTAAWLRDHADHPELRIVDVRWSLGGPPGRRAYEQGHLPGAIFLDLDTELAADPSIGPGRHPLPGASALADALGAHGIGDEHTVVAYDDAGGSVASRLWWLFRHWGHDAAVLDGGLRAWTDADGALTTAAPDHPAATWTPGVARDDVVDAGELVRRRDAGRPIIDARAAERYRGEVEPVDARPGHIPGARSAPWAGNLDATGRFLSSPELAKRYAALSAGPASEPVAYCGSGVNATHALLAMHLAGIEGTLYEGSWSDWASHDELPAAIGPQEA